VNENQRLHAPARVDAEVLSAPARLNRSGLLTDRQVSARVRHLAGGSVRSRMCDEPGRRCRRSDGYLYVAPFALVAVLLVSSAAVLVSNALAAWPGHMAAPSRPADSLRTE
jgi:hypothetical protein